MKDLFNYSQWPWVEESNIFPQYYKGNQEWPKLSIIIPSLNQGSFIEETILSVIRQNYPNLELIIIDGGSKDNTIDIIKKYESDITYWVSEKDEGQSHAINKGLEKATGSWIAWLNSDDCYLKNAAYYLFKESDVEPYDFIYGNYLTGKNLTESKNINVINSEKLNFSKAIRFFYGIEYIIPSQSVFVKRELFKKTGLLNEELHYCMDVDWYIRMFLHKPKVWKYEKTICFFRYNENTKTGSFKKSEPNKMGQEAEGIALEYSKYLNFVEKVQFLDLYNYYLRYSKEPWTHDHCSLGYLLKIIILHPYRSISDRRILGLLKRKLSLNKKLRKLDT